MMSDHTLVIHVLSGSLIAALVVSVAYVLKMLTPSGTISAFILGVIVFGLGGLSWAIILILFFLSSSGLSLLFRTKKNQVEKMYAKGSIRDYRQVLANGGVAGLFTIIHFFFPQSILPWIGFCAAFAAANADTWATELGIFNRRNPVLIVSGKSVEPGTSGAVSAVGTLAAASGALLIGLGSWLVWPNDLLFTTSTSRIWFAGTIFFAGFSGSLVDSILGATLQAIYKCPNCQRETEKHPLHGCGIETTQIRGLIWMGNDWVNTFCTLSASLIVIVMSLF
ncbi:MAG: hypothetical protein FD147_1985 [Chloroflexi bacterium]|nr:MAG: hypothetical protein FD147_1985 [Chloroflexota bacterium]